MGDSFLFFRAAAVLDFELPSRSLRKINEGYVSLAPRSRKRGSRFNLPSSLIPYLIISIISISSSELRQYAMHIYSIKIEL